MRVANAFAIAAVQIDMPPLLVVKPYEDSQDVSGPSDGILGISTRRRLYKFSAFQLSVWT